MSVWLMNLQRWEDWLKPTLLRLIAKNKALSFPELKSYLDDIKDDDLQGGLNNLMDIGRICESTGEDGIVRYSINKEMQDAT